MLKQILFFTLFSSFGLLYSQTYFNGQKVNTNPLNKKYRESRKSIYGKLKLDEYKHLKSELEKELNTKIPEGKSIFISFEQAASNCSLVKDGKAYLQGFHYLHTSFAGKMSNENNTVDFYLYDANSFLKSYTEKNIKYRLDSGYFATKIFTLKENCEAFFILKPNGKFLISYGSDNLTKASELLKE